MVIRGIDVSKWQSIIDWQMAKSDDLGFAILREGYGKSNTDKQFERNYDFAKRYNIPIGVYHYSYADTVSEAKREADYCLANIYNKKLEYPICYDVEDRTQLSLSNLERTEIVKAFCDEIEKAGYYAMLYCNLNWYNNYFIREEIEKYDLWIAEWEVPKPSVNCGIWQYSEKGSLDYINGNVDLNISYKNYPEIMIKKGLNGFSEQDTIQVPPKENHYIYTVVSGDTLWDISEKYLGSGLKYKDIMELNELKSDKIYVGQKIKLPI